MLSQAKVRSIIYPQVCLQKFVSYQHVGRFLDPNAVALRQVFPKQPITRIINDDHLPLPQQVARGGHFG